MSHASTQAGWNQVADWYLAQFGPDRSYENAWIHLLYQLKGNEKVLEIGTGPGILARYFLNQHPRLDWLGYDYAPAMVALAKSTVPEARFEQKDARELNVQKDASDLVINAFCSPYLNATDNEALLAKLVALLKEGGILYWSHIEADYAFSGREWSSDGKIQMDVWYYPEGWLEARLKAHGLIITYNELVTFGRPHPISNKHRIVIAKKINNPEIFP